jgi:hypothetical protein
MQPKELAKAVLQAKALGVELSTVEAISSSLLQFESSIENELAAELLIGRDLNLEKARTLALNGNIAGVAEEIATQIGSAEDFTNMNVIQQEALAKAVGMTRDQLAGSLIERQALAAIGEGDETALEAYNRLKEKGLSDDAIAVRLGDEKLAANLKNQSVQDRFNKSVEKLREIFVSIAGPIMQIISPIVDILVPAIGAIQFLLSPLIEGFALIGKGVNYFVEGIKQGQPAMVALLGIMVALKAQTILTAIFKIFQSFANIPFGLGLPLAGVAVLGMISLANKSAKTGNDIMSPGENTPGYGKRTLMGPEGAIALNDKDTVIAGTKLFGDDVKSEPDKATEMFEKGDNNFEGDNSINPPSNTSSPSSSPQNNSLIIAEIRALRTSLESRPINVNTTVELDGEKIGSSKNVIRGLGNSSTELGTELSTNSSNLQ